ncbi:MAG: methylated-DNA--[protein]-cysteine S-methyltransferase [Deltaproteobacteria bacterium]|nr:methylated-DNA--[protein]-cysteine S-methyltransferase [Deltaproteobacteria bacterium]
MLSTLGESTENTRIHLDGLYNCLIRYFTKKEWLIDVKIDFSGYKDKEIHILRNLMKVPPGYITTYCLLARYTLKSNAYRYIGNILAHNRLQLIVPCHRVVKNNLKLGGFTNPLGIELKILLLQNEGIIVNNNKIEHPRIYQF